LFRSPGLRHCDATPSRWSKENDGAAELSREFRGAGRVESPLLLARRTTGTAPTTGPDCLMAYRPPRGTPCTQPPATRRLPFRHLRSKVRGRSPPRIVVGAHAFPRMGDQAKALEDAQLGQPVDACWLPSQLLRFERCDDQLNSPWVPWSE